MENIFFKDIAKTQLCDIMTSHGSDKGNHFWHNYTCFYDSIFSSIREQPLKIFELGLGTNNLKVKSNMGEAGRPGASHRGWREYFPNAEIYGADIDKGVLFKEERIDCSFYCDQTSEFDIKKLWSNFDNVEFDILIDDGLHHYDANKVFFENSIHKVKEGGYYIIEDILIKERYDFLKYFSNVKNAKMIELLIKDNIHDNRLIALKI